MSTSHSNNHIVKHFHCGRLRATPGALLSLAKANQPPGIFLDRHLAGDWGDVSENDRRANDRSFLDGSQILSAYTTSCGEKIWIVTDAEPRAVTTILLPEEY